MKIRCACGALLTADHQRSIHVRPTPHGPGTELARLFAEIAVKEKPGCNCRAVAAEMDGAGVAGCREKRDYFLAKLNENAALYGWWEKLSAGRAAWAQGKPLTLGGLFDEAIRRAEATDDRALAELAGPAVPREADWHLRPDVLAGQQALLDRVVAARPQSPEWFAGRGIVTCGGTAKYFGAAWVLVSLLRKLGCTLPVEWWYLGPSEMDPRMIALAESLGGVQCVDLYERLPAHGRHPRRMAGWESKVWAVMFSRFAECLWLDADNVPAVDPTYLFDDPRYREPGALFWPDFPPMGWSVSAAAFDVCRLPIPARASRPQWHNPTDYRPFETGQFLVDKRRHWPALELAAAICDHSDFWFPREHRGRPWHIYGDKDAFYLAWERLGGQYAMPPAAGADVRFAGSNRAGAFMQHDCDGRLLFQHRVQPAVKWRLHDENPEVPGSLHHADCLAALDRLRGQWSGRVYDPADESPAERSIASACHGRKIWFHPGGQELLTLGPDGDTGTSEWRFTIRGEHLLLCTFDRLVAAFGRDDKGNWCNHGSENFLMDAPPAEIQCPLERQELAIWNDMQRDNEYRLPDRFAPDDLIIDIGGHCGFFAHACLSRGAGRVISVEPHPENFQRLEHNLRPFDPAVLFLCSGNYYRSRYAEAVFNHLARERGLSWRAESRGLNSQAKPGPIMRQAADALRAAGIPFDERHSRDCTAADLERARLIVAVKAAEHGPMMAQRFAAWKDATEYWSIDDMDVAPASEVLPKLHAQVAALLDRLPVVAPRSTRIHAAAWSQAGELFLAQPDGARHTGGWCAVGVREGVPARAIPFDSLVSRPVRLVKLDCEGSEWEILRGCRTFPSIAAWCGEWHQRQYLQADAELRGLLEPHGYRVVVEPHPESDRLGHFWASR